MNQWCNYKKKLDKCHFLPEAVTQLILDVKEEAAYAEKQRDGLEEDHQKEYEHKISILEKIQNDVIRELPILYERYCRDIRFACENGLDVPYEELAGYEPGAWLDYSVFDGYFEKLKKLIKAHENDLEVIMDLISAKERMEAIRVILLEAEAKLKLLFEDKK